MARKRQICIRLTEDEFERVQNVGVSPRDLLIQACEKIADNGAEISGNLSVESSDTGGITDSSTIDAIKLGIEEEVHQEVEEEKRLATEDDETFGWDNGFEIGKLDGLAGREKDDPTLEGDNYSEGYNAGYDRGLQQREQTRSEEAQREANEKQKAFMAKRHSILEIFEEKKNFIYNIDTEELGKALREKGISFSDLSGEERRIIFEAVNDNSDLIHSVTRYLNEFIQGLGYSEELDKQVETAYREMLPSFKSRPIWL
jgi:hypothetical protein